MFGVRPIMPWVYAPTFHVPMSSPQITRMLGRGELAPAALSDLLAAGFVAIAVSMIAARGGGGLLPYVG
jgi:hypothetical protein